MKTHLVYLSSLLKISKLFVILLIVTDVRTIRIVHQTTMEPNIRLLGYQVEDTFHSTPAESDFQFQDQYQNDYVSKNKSDYVISEYTNLIDFTCSADYPIIWKFPFPEQLKDVHYTNIGTEEHSASDFNPYAERPTSTHFYTYIRFLLVNVDFLSVNLTCNSVENGKSKLQSSIYIYLKGKSEIEHEGETLQVFAPPTDSFIQPHLTVLPPVIIPCRPSSPNSKISLDRQETHIRGYSPANIFSTPKVWTVWGEVLVDGNHITFDPKTGFTIHRDLFGNHIFGSYKCTVMIPNYNDGINSSLMEYVESDQFVYVNVTTQVNTTKITGEIFQHRSIVHGKASVRLTEYPYTKFVCCSGYPGKPPKLYVEQCTDSLQCELAKNTVLEGIANKSSVEGAVRKTRNDILSKLSNISSDCAQDFPYHGSYIVVCRGENVDYMDHLITVFHPLAAGSVTNRSNRLINEMKKIDRNSVVTFATLTQHVSSADTINTTQKMLILVGREASREKLLKSKSLHGLFVYVLNHGIQSSYKYNINDDNIFKNSKHYLLEYDRDIYYENEPMVFMCFGIKYAYSNGAYMILTWKNGTRTLLMELETEGSAEPIRFLYLNGPASMFDRAARGVSKFTKSVLATREMSSVDCWMPKKNSTEWERSSKEIKVLPSIAPSFEEKLDETLYFYLGDVGRVVTCTLKRGQPLANINVFINGKGMPLKITYQNAPKHDQQQPHDQRRPLLRLVNPTEDVYLDRPQLDVTMGFSAIRHDHHGVYQCVAKNLNSTVTRTVRIFVLEKRGITLPVTIGCVIGILGLVLVGLGGIKHWRDKRMVRLCRPATNIN